MIQKIEIHNFRCFEETKISGFKRVNLIGGKNNSGKTALLEALYLNNSQTPFNVVELRRIRGERLAFLKAFPENAWNSLFFNQDKDKCIKFISDGEVTEFKINSDVPGENRRIIEKVEDENKFESSESGYKQSRLTVNWIANTETWYTCFVASSDGIELASSITPGVYKKNVHFIPASYRLANTNLASEFDQADFNGNSDKVLNVIKLIDQTIVQIKAFNLGEHTLYLKREEGGFLPISLFGEAIIKITDIVLKIINYKSSILLIDEIENGIHHTNQFEFWKRLFKLAKEFDIQIFATTHSGEMIRAFANAGLEESEQGNDDTAAYIELARNVRTGRIAGIVRDIEQLDYALTHEMGVRGE